MKPHLSSTQSAVCHANEKKIDIADEYACLGHMPETSQAKQIVKLSPRKLRTNKRNCTVIPVDEYETKLQDIIERDYFPELSTLKAQSEYLDALQSNDLSKIRELQIRYSSKRYKPPRQASPSTWRETPSSVVGSSTCTPFPNDLITNSTIQCQREDEFCNRMGDNESIDEPRISLDQFLNKYTNEDNASFEVLAALDIKRERDKKAWMFETASLHNEKEQKARENNYIAAADEQLALANAPNDKPKELDNWYCKARNTVLFNLDECPLTLSERSKRNKMSQKMINRSATRFDSAFCKARYQKSELRSMLRNERRRDGKVDIMGHEIGSNVSDLQLLSTPSIAPGVDASPLMTWGEIEGTPFTLDASDMLCGNDTPSFKMPEAPLRERYAHGMTEDIAKSYFKKRVEAIRQAEKCCVKTPTFGSARSTDRLLSMSSAARRLATKNLGIRLGTDDQLKASYTPGRISKSSSSFKTPLSPTTKGIHSQPISVNKQPSPGTKSHSITDNLLNINDSTKFKNERLSAVDFF